MKWAVVLALALSGCNSSPYGSWTPKKTAEHADIADVNARNALARVDALESRVDDLESELEELKDAKADAE